MIRRDLSRFVFIMIILSSCFFEGCSEGRWQKADSSLRSSLVTHPERTAVARMPKYRVLSAVRLLSGHYFAEILIPGFSRKTPIPVREAALRQIARIEDLAKASLYSTQEAFKAHNSEWFAKMHPNAMKTGYLGTLDGKAFVPGEVLYR